MFPPLSRSPHRHLILLCRSIFPLVAPAGKSCQRRFGVSFSFVRRPPFLRISSSPFFSILDSVVFVSPSKSGSWPKNRPRFGSWVDLFQNWAIIKLELGIINQNPRIGSRRLHNCCVNSANQNKRHSVKQRPHQHWANDRTGIVDKCRTNVGQMSLTKF